MVKKSKPKKERKNKNRLKPGEELFCQLYAGDTECFNNAVVSYMIAFKYLIKDKDSKGFDQDEYDRKYNVAGASASRMLRKVKIMKRCNEILRQDFKEEIADGEMFWTIKQRDDLGAKMRAISEFNKLRGRVNDGSAGVNVAGDLNINLTPERKAQIAGIIQRIKNNKK